MPRSVSVLAALLFALPAAAQVPADRSLATMTPGDGLQVGLFAAEPMLVNPTAIDVDARGRVWVAEAVNYRRVNFNRPILREAGDRIVILTDTDGDGSADRSDVFYQGRELYGPLSVLVLPLPGSKVPAACRVLVAQSPDILEFIDADGDGKADGPPSKFLTGFGGFDHDHGVHGLTTGPDGKLYFTVGDQGVKGLQSKDGKGRKFVTSNDPKSDCQAGTVWRCDLDGTNLELIAHNFRNNYEACVDSFGEIWLSDNDDDGNQQTRICHVMPGGNYGYWPRGAGQSHWHEEQPGVVHKTLRTGFGSPTGIAFYEGNLFPQLTGQLLHCDAGTREVRAFQRKPKGAGYELDKTLLLTSSDTWFRPSDVCVGPDGSIFVADWYDPGVGGHGMGDWTRGRIYRLTPKGHAGYKVPAVKLDTHEGFTDALNSPCLATRSLAIAHHQANPKDSPLQTAVQISQEQKLGILKVRTAWYDNGSTPHIPLGFAWIDTVQDDERYRTNYWSQRVRQHVAFFNGFTHLPEAGWKTIPGHIEYSTQGFRRELLIAFRTADAEQIKKHFYPLARLYDGQDHFYRAALNIACGTDPVRRDAILADFDKQFPEWNDKVADLVWELRPKVMLAKLGPLMADPKFTAAQKARIVDILAASDEPTAGKTMLGLLTGDQPAEVKARALDNLRLFLPTKWKALAGAGDLGAAVTQLLRDGRTRTVGLQLVAAAKFSAGRAEVAAVARDATEAAATRAEAVRTLGQIPSPDALQVLLEVARPGNPLAADAVRAVGLMLPAGSKADATGRQALDALKRVILAPESTPGLRTASLAALAGNRAGTQWLLEAIQNKTLPESLTPDAGRLLRNSPFQGERNKAMLLFPAPGKLDPKHLPSANVLARRTGNAARGEAIMRASATGEVQCLKCHMVGGQGGQIGPDLSLIGKKGSKENLLDSILTPSKAIADQYASWTIDTDDGQTLTGLIVGESESTVTLRDANGKDYALSAKGLARKKSLVSLMPEGLVATLTEDELVDLVEYLMTLQTPSLTPESWTVEGPYPAADDKAIEAPLQISGPGRVVRAGANGYVDLAAFHGPRAPRSVSVLTRVIESPADQEVTLLVGTDDGCRLSVNGVGVLSHDRHDAATPGRDRVKVKLKKGENAITLRISNGDNPHGFYFTIEGGVDLKAK